MAQDVVDAQRGRLDVLVNNASNFYPTPLGTVTPEQWHDLVGSNLKAPLFLSQALLPALRAARGVIINIVDVHSQRPLRDHPVYGAAKAGLAMLTRSLAKDLGPAHPRQRRVARRDTLARRRNVGRIARRHHQADGAQAQRRARGHRQLPCCSSCATRPTSPGRSSPSTAAAASAGSAALSRARSARRRRASVSSSARSPRGPTALTRDGMHELGCELGERTEHERRREQPGPRQPPSRVDARPVQQQVEVERANGGIDDELRPASASIGTQRVAHVIDVALGGQRQHEIEVVRRPGRRRPRCDRRSSSEPRRTAARARSRLGAARARGRHCCRPR